MANNKNIKGELDLLKESIKGLVNSDQKMKILKTIRDMEVVLELRDTNELLRKENLALIKKTRLFQDAIVNMGVHEGRIVTDGKITIMVESIRVYQHSIELLYEGPILEADFNMINKTDQIGTISLNNVKYL